MKEKKIFSIIIFIVFCTGKIVSQSIPDSLSLSGVQIGDNHYDAVNINSTQIIESGRTTYRASNAITLKPGFHAKSGSDFRASMDDFSGRLDIMTYNLGPDRNIEYYDRHAEIIKESGADVVSLQEVRGVVTRYNRLIEKTRYKGKMGVTINFLGFRYGIAMLWNEAKIGAPISVRVELINTPNDDDPKRAYIVAEWDDYIVIATHLPLNATDSYNMVTQMLNESFITNYRKPVYLAGDLNPNPSSAIELPVAAGFEILNDTANLGHATRPGNTLIDLILELNNNPSRELIWRGIPDSSDDSYTISDHLPYLVKLNYK